MINLISLINISERGGDDLFDYILTKPEVKYSNKGHEKIYRTEEAYETLLPQNDNYYFLFFICFCSPFSFFDQASNSKRSFL